MAPMPDNGMGASEHLFIFSWKGKKISTSDGYESEKRVGIST
jgi:hypothetical protein